MAENELVKPVELEISKITLGTLVTNAKELKEAVFAKFDGLTPGTYEGDVESAKAARSYINSNIKKLNERRLELERKWNEPFSEFKNIVNETVEFLKEKSGFCDIIVKEKEKEEREKRCAFVKSLWNSKNFDLVPFEKILVKSWLNKTAKESVISDEMDSIIKRIYDDLKVIEKEDDSETLKAHYLVTLNLSSTLSYGEEIKKAKILSEKESKERAEREHNQKLKEQQRDIAERALEQIKSDSKPNLASEALGVKDGPIVNEYVISVKTTEKQLLQIKSALTSLGIEYDVELLSF